MGKQSREKQLRRDGLIVPDKEGGKNESQTGFEKACLYIIRWGAYLVLFTPLVVSVKFFFPFVAPKTIFFRVVVEILFIAYLFLVASNWSKYRPRINALTLTLFVFLAVFILSSFTGINLSRSFWSTHERMTGILTMLHLFAFFIILSSTFRKRDDWEKFFGVSVIVGVLLSLYILKGSEVSTRGGGTIGNTSFMAAYLLFDIFFALILFLSNFLKKGGWPVFWQVFSGISLPIMIPVLFSSTARGAIAAFFVGIFLLFLGYLIFSGKKYLKISALAIILLAIVSAAFLAVFQPYFIKNKAAVQLKEMQSRFVVWETGLKAFSERPILGWGPENFNSAYLKHFNPCMSLPQCGTEVWFDRVHNIIFDTLTATGLAGLLSYLAIFTAAFYGLLKALLKIDGRRGIFIPLGMIAVLTVYFIQNLLVFDMINTYLVFFLVLAFISFWTKEQPETEGNAAARKINPILAVAVIAALAFVSWTTNIKPLFANYYIIKMVGSQNPDEASLFFKNSLDTWMEKYESREQFNQKVFKSVYQGMTEEDKNFFQGVLDLAKSEMEKSVEENYLDFRPHLFLGELYISSYRLSGNAEELARAQKILERAIQLSPTNQQGYWQMAEAKIAEGKIDETISVLKKAAELDPRVSLSHWYLAMAYSIKGDWQSALSEVKEAKSRGFDWLGDAADREKIIQIIFKAGEDPLEIYTNFESEWLEYFINKSKSYPDDFTAWFYLAATYANLGQYDKARQAAQKVIELKPSYAQTIKEFLKSLPE